MSKKQHLLVCLIVCLIVVTPPKLALAETASPSGVNTIKNGLQERLGNIKERVQEKLSQRKEKIAEQILQRIRKSVEVRYNVFTRAVNHTEILLSRIQIRIDKAQQAGKDITELNSLMADAKAKLADAKTKLDEIKALKGTAVDKEGFLTIQVKFKEIRQDIHIARQDAAKMIRILKGFNSATSQGQNLQPESTNPASVSP